MEIRDSVSKLLKIKTEILIDGIFICACNLPTTNENFKLFLRDFYTWPMILNDFYLEASQSETIIRCKISYGQCTTTSEPLFRFFNQTLHNIQLIKTQLKNLSFSYKVTRTHLWFQVQETDIRFFYNASLDKFATSPRGQSYNQFLDSHKDKILDINHANAVQMPGTSTGPQSTPPPPTGQPAQQLAPAPPPPARTETAQSSQSSTAAAAATNYETPRSRSTYGPPQTGFSRNLLPVIENLDSITSPRYFVSGAAARLDLGATTRLTHNYRVIKEIAADKNVSLDTDLLAKMFISPSWNIKNSVLLNLAVNGIISISDNRVATEGDTVDKEVVTDKTDKTIDQEWEVNAEENTTNE